MPYINQTDYMPSAFFRNGHINTMYPFAFRKRHQVQYQRIRLDTPDQDFLDIDCLQNNNRKAVIICHGLEGSSESQYMLGIANHLSKNQYDVLAMNFRSCSGEMNNKLRLYHSGATDDLHFVINHFANQYDEIALLGYSLGGNLILKYNGDGLFPLVDKIKVSIAISAPTDLSAGSAHLQRKSNWPYEYRFLKNLGIKVHEKHKQYPDKVSLEPLRKIKTLWDFDEYYTAPIHGFDGAEDYYAKCSCGPHLVNVKKPCYIINALDDPFLPEESYPIQTAQDHALLTLITPQYGGHVGFYTPKSEAYWSDITILELLKKHIDD